MPNDALGLITDGWTRNERFVLDRYGVDDVMSCGERVDLLAKADMPVTVESYAVPDTSGGWITVTYLDYGDPATATKRLSGFADAATVCDDGEGAPPYVPTAIAPVGNSETFGFTAGVLRSWVVANDDGSAVLFQGAYLGSDDVHLLNERAEQWLDP